MDVLTLVALHDQNARSEVDARLHFTQRAGGSLAGSTRNIIYATDPLKNISYPFEAIMTVPTDPPSNKVQLIGGHFFANGKLYSFPGMETPEIEIDLNQDTYVLTGIKIDPKTDRTDLYVQTTYGEYPFMDRDVVPSALIKIPHGFNSIVSGYIMDIRPFLHYNVSTPEDRAVIDISCINPKESVSFELMRNRRMPPIINFYKKLPPEGTHTITHSFKAADDVVVLGDDPVDVSEEQGVTLKKQITAEAITMPDADNVLVVSAMTGSNFGDGTASAPLLTLTSAIERYNVMPQYDTIFVREGIYVMNTPVRVRRAVQIIGEAPTKVIVQFLDNSATLITSDPSVGVVFRTMQFVSMAYARGATASVTMSFSGPTYFYNCIFKQASSTAILPFIRYSDWLRIANCVLHNPYRVSASQSAFYFPAESDALRFYNNYVIGPWKTPLPIDDDHRNYRDDGTGSILMLDDFINYYPTDKTPYGVHDGLAVGSTHTDLDGKPISVGLYGGAYASLFRMAQYPIDQMPVFKYAYHTLFAPVIARFVEFVPLIPFISSTAGCKVYGAVSFNGGHDWVVWDEYLGAWKRVADLQTLDVNGNTAEELSTRLVNNGPITTKGEICFAWALKTNNPNYSPSIKGVQMRVKADADTLTPIQPETFDVWIAGDTIMVTNLADEKQNDVVIVAY